MRTPRRHFLTLAGGALIARPARARETGASDPLAALPPFLDTLIPGDTALPSATDLGLHHEIRTRARHGSRGEAFLEEGCAWLDRAAREAGQRDFAALDGAAREALVRRAEAAPAQEPERRFFDTVRHALVVLYWSDPRTWAGIGYAGPPQPRGFPDHQHPPRGHG